MLEMRYPARYLWNLSSLCHLLLRPSQVLPILSLLACVPAIAQVCISFCYVGAAISCRLGPSSFDDWGIRAICVPAISQGRLACHILIQAVTSPIRTGSRLWLWLRLRQGRRG